MLFFWTILSSKTVFNIDFTDLTLKWAANQHITMISERSCDTADWNNNVENSPLHHRNKLHFKIYLNRNSYYKL